MHISSGFISELKVQCSDLVGQLRFYKSLGYACEMVSERVLTVTLGRSKIFFRKVANKNPYHYCILVSRNIFTECIDLLNKQGIQSINDDQKSIIHNKAWDSDSIYFMDGDGNIAEFIVHNLLDDDVETQIAEMGIVSENTAQISQRIGQSLGLRPFRSTSNRFIDCGFPGTMFIIIDPNQKSFWFPSKISPIASSFEGVFSCKSRQYSFIFEDEFFSASQING